MSPVESDEGELTRKQRREQARTDRKAAEEAAASGAARKRRLTQLGIVAAVVVVGIVIVLIATGGSSSKKPATAKEKTKTSTEVAALLAGIPESGNTLGNPNAPVTLQYFGDLQCPICREFTEGALPPIIRNQVRAGNVKIQYHSLETATREPEVFQQQQIAALAAGKQSHMWPFIETFYKEQGTEDTGYVTENFIQGIAKQVPGLNLSQWQSDRNNAAFPAEIATDAQTANNKGMTGTPSFLIGKTGGPLTKLEYSSLTNPKGFEEAIEKAKA
jgi:protein-disulfide isomerase